MLTSLGWVLFYIGAVCVFTTHVCLGWAKVAGGQALGIPKRYRNKAAHIGRDIVEPGAEDEAQKACPDLEAMTEVAHDGKDLVPQKFVDESAPEAQPDVAEVYALPPDEKCAVRGRGRERFWDDRGRAAGP